MSSNPDPGSAIKTVRLRTNQYPSGRVDQIEIHVCDLWFYADINSERDVRLAQMIAEQSGVEFVDWRKGEQE